LNSGDNLKQLADKVKQAGIAIGVFRKHHPGHYREHGNSRCPYHDDQTESLQLEADHVFCHAGCTPGTNGSKRWSPIDIEMAATGCDFPSAVKNLAKEYNITAPSRAERRRRIKETYPYTDQDGILLYENVRFDPKDFRMRRPDGKGDWIWNLQDTPRVLYNLPSVVESETVYSEEGEKDANLVISMDLTGTTLPMGAGKVRTLDEKWGILKPLYGKKVRIIPDKDKPGLDHAQEEAARLVGKAASIKILELPGLGPKEDVSDLVEREGLEKVKSLILQLELSTPEYVPPIEPPATQIKPGQKTDVQEKPAKESRFQKLRQIFEETGAPVFLDQFDQAWMTVDGRNIPIDDKSKKFKRSVTRLYFGAFQEPIGDENIKNFALHLQAHAGESRELHNRFCGSETEILIDMANEAGEIIRITSDGWKVIVPEQNVFQRYTHQKPLPYPSRPGDAEVIFELIRAKDLPTRILIGVWIISVALSHIARPGIIAYGPQGGGKTNECRTVRSLLDPSNIVDLSLPRDSEALIQILSHHAIPVFDNLGRLPQAISDDLCRAVTGLGYSKRLLYSNDDTFCYQLRRPFLANGLNIPGQSPDLLDRCILLSLDRLEDSKRQNETGIWDRFNSLHSTALGGICDILSKAISIRPSITLKYTPRMSDWTSWGCAISEALGFGQQTFLDAYNQNISIQHDEVTSDEPICLALRRHMNSQDYWSGSISDLWKIIESIGTNMNLTTSRRWPKTSPWFAKRLRQFEHNLKSIGIEIEFTREDGERFVRIVKRTIGQEIDDSPRDSNDSNVTVKTGLLSSTIPHGQAPSENRDSNDSNFSTFNSFKNKEEWGCCYCQWFKEDRCCWENSQPLLEEMAVCPKHQPENQDLFALHEHI
jgi:hypothetical protein